MLAEYNEANTLKKKKNTILYIILKEVLNLYWSWNY